MVNILHVGCKYNILCITYFIVLIAADNLKSEISQNVTKIRNALLYSRNSPLYTNIYAYSWSVKNLVLWIYHIS